MSVIEDLKDIKNSIEDIANKYDIPKSTVYCIYRKDSWKYLTENIDFPKRERGYLCRKNTVNENSIKTIVQYLLDGKSNAEISRLTNIHVSKISMIRHHETYNRYTSNIDFPIVDERTITPGRSKLTEDQVKEIYHLYNIGYNKSDIANKYCISTSSVTDIVTGRTWKNLFVKYNVEKVSLRERKHKVGIPIKCVTTGKTYDSIIAAAKDTKCGQRQIKMMCDGIEVKTHNGYVFEYDDNKEKNA